MIQTPVFFEDTYKFVHYFQDCTHARGSTAEVDTVFVESVGASYLCSCLSGGSKAMPVGVIDAVLAVYKKYLMIGKFDSGYHPTDYSEAYELCRTVNHVSSFRRDPRGMGSLFYKTLALTPFEGWSEEVWKQLDAFLDEALQWERSPLHKDFLTNYYYCKLGDRQMMWGEVGWSQRHYDELLRAFGEYKDGERHLLRAPLGVFRFLLDSNFEDLTQLVDDSLMTPEVRDTTIGLFATGGLYESFFEAFEAAKAVV